MNAKERLQKAYENMLAKGLISYDKYNELIASLE